MHLLRWGCKNLVDEKMVWIHQGWSFDDIIAICVLFGYDFLPRHEGLGPKTANKMFKYGLDVI